MRSILLAATALAVSVLGTAGFARDIAGTPDVDLLRGTPDADHITGLGGHDDLMGFGGDDVMEGGDGSDELFGGAGNDTLQGGGGDDYLDGRSGDDSLTGGPGRDIFAFYARDANRPLDNGSDTITDFAPGEDAILLVGLGVDDIEMRTEGADMVIAAPGLVLVTLRGVAELRPNDLIFR
ncbi:hypothetical protein [uncultured Paracoccus sp.]|uniref:M10 family metallopeptidase C-terminal domain-containing protein n=1 Tax=uncultured Paracoccus sp. TaxID=189685 RepID=UPI002613917F|nr:hypothetical protein [uncultured Paracoccus sp.]